MRHEPPILIYFVKPVGMDGPIKIGCSRHPEHRLLSLVAWAPFPLEIVVTIPGGFDLEQNIHECFANSHSHSEWFHVSERLNKLMSDLVSGVPIGQALDLSAREGLLKKGKKGRKLSDSTRLRMSYSQRLRHAQERVGEWPPAHVREIMHEWGGDPYFGVSEKIPTPDKLAIVDQYLANAGKPVQA